MGFELDSINQHVRLVCPLTHASLVQDGDSLVACEPEHRLRYAVRDEIPVMLVDEASEVPLDEWSELMRQHGRDPQSGEPLAAQEEGK